jgi:hypothetical protein
MCQDPGSSCRRRLTSTTPLRCSILLTMGGLLSVVFCGCGAGEYNKLLAARTAKAKSAATFNELYAPQALEDTPASVRIPQVFVTAPMVEGRGNPVDPRQLKPGLVTMAFLKLTYEAYIKDDKGGLPYYCYVGAIKAAADQLSIIPRAMRAELSNKRTTELSDWSDFQGQSPEGREVPWKKLRCVATQEFACTDTAGKVHFKSLPGVLEIYVHEENGCLVVIAWRMPESIEPNVDVTKWAPLMAGCVSIKQ